jgi:hypothetical protein
MPSVQKLDTHHKALTLNLDPSTFGSFAEIGAGQEVARWFLLVGAASGTVAKSISAYDKFGYENVCGLDVAVNNPRSVGSIQTVGNLDSQAQQYPRFQRAVRKVVLQRCPIHKLHRDKTLAIMLADFVSGADIRMVKRRSRSSFPPESLNLPQSGRLFILRVIDSMTMSAPTPE